jgi:CAI-1 autoinducer synthase
MGSNAKSSCLNNEPEFLQNALSQYYEGRVKNSWDSGHILKGKSPNNDSLIFTSNDYLTISKHPKLINAQISALKRNGNGLLQSSVFQKKNSPQTVLERDFARFFNHQDCLLSQSGWCANIGLIQAIAMPNIPIYLDFYAHMSFWEGAKSAQAKVIPFLHNSIDSLVNRIKKFGSGIIAIDAVYSTLGTLSPLSDFCAIAKQYGCVLIIDESHSLGTHGLDGKGLVYEHGLSKEVHFITASLAKAFSGRGGLVLSSHECIEYLRYSAFPAIFSSALLPHDIAAFNSALSIFLQEPWRQKKLHDNAKWLKDQLLANGYNLHESNSQIIPLVCGNEKNTILMRNHLERYNIFGSIFCWPATPKNRSLIRLSVNTSHTISELERVVLACLDALPRMKSLSLPMLEQH